jgi:transketolase
MDDFGASGPAEDLFKHFGFSAENLVNKILEVIENN